MSTIIEADLPRATSVREMWQPKADVFSRNSTKKENENNDEEELMWAAFERLPTYDRVRKGMLTQTTSKGKLFHHEVDVTKLGPQDKKQLIDNVLKIVENDNERLLRRIRDRVDR